MIGLLLGMCSAINWIQSIIFILGIHYEVVHDIISYACKFVLSVLVIFIVFYSHRYSRYHDSGLAFHLRTHATDRPDRRSDLRHALKHF